jgi:hypothetical protein
MRLESLARPFDDRELPALDRRHPSASLSKDQVFWRQRGYLILPGLIPEALIAAYSAAWLAEHGPESPEGDTGGLGSYRRPGGWPHATPYMDCLELKDLVTWRPLVEQIAHLIGEPMGVHLNLTGWRSTLRDWHQDGYLNPDHVADYYAAVWIALDDIHPDSGPFEYVPGTHRWPAIRQDLMLRALHEDGQSPTWPERSEQLLTPVFERRFEEEGRQTHRFHAHKGDVLIWHARLAHRGSPPRNDQLVRKALIAHYSGIFHRPDMPPPTHDPGSGWYFPIQARTPLRTVP